VYGILRLQDLARRGVLAGLGRLDYEGVMFLAEFGLGVLLPVLLLATPRVRARQSGLVIGAFLTVLGFVMNRLNVSITGMERASGAAYFPSWVEVAISLALVAAGFAVFGLAVHYLPVFRETVPSRPGLEAPAWLVARSTASGARGASLSSGTAQPPATE
jgi:Ni/Fe-hydrogenase subunit HybB-like protein